MWARRSAWLVAMAIVATATYVDPDLTSDSTWSRPTEACSEAILAIEIRGRARDCRSSSAIGADRIRMAYLRDGSGIGAAVLAAMSGQ